MNPAARPTPGPVLDRRRLGMATALGAGALVVSACTDRRTAGEDLPTAGKDPDLALVAEVSSVLAGRVRLLEETIARHPGLAPRLAALTDAHRAHLAALAEVVPPQAGGSPPASPSPSATTDAPTPVPTPVPGSPRPALADVVAAGSAGADELTRLAFRARSGPLARLVAGMAASTAMHVAHLTARLPEGVAP